MPGSLLDELPSMDEDKSLSSILCWRRDTVDKLSEDDLQRHSVFSSANRRTYSRSCRCLWLEISQASYVPSADM